jgi:hypothetical protein
LTAENCRNTIWVTGNMPPKKRIIDPLYSFLIETFTTVDKFDTRTAALTELIEIIGL